MSNFRSLLHEREHRVLVVDDTKSIHDDFNRIFSQYSKPEKHDELEDFLFDKKRETSKNDYLKNITIKSSYSGEDGIRLVKQSIADNNEFSVAIIDVRMPGGIDGIEAASEIFKIDKNIQIVICSAYNDYSWDQMIDILSFNDRWVILKKPFDVIEARQMAVSLCQKWVLLKEMKTQIADQTKQLEEQIARLKSAKNKIYDLAYYDTVTQLPNRLFFNELLKQCMLDANKSRTLLGLLFIDLDNFKKINDSFGHQTGDKVLKLVASRLSEFVRSSDVVSRFVDVENNDKLQFNLNYDYELITASRFGGDEFTVLLRNFSSENDLLSAANRILGSISDKPFIIDGVSHDLTASIGLSIYPLDDDDAGKILKNADIAMYHAKNSGKNTVVIHNEALNKRVIQKNKIERAIPNGLANNEFFLVYQPKISLVNKKIIGCEALIRWNHPKEGVLIPADFIPTAEESQLIVEIDKYVINEVCKQLKKWQDIPLLNKLLTSINLSAKFFHQKDASSIIINTLADYQVCASRLELEITETCLINSSEQVISCVTELNDSLQEKLSVAIDDFGVGYSSLNYLCDLPIDTVKIDKSFIQKMNSDASAHSIVHSVIKLSHTLNYHVVAEGVECDTVLEELQTMGCDQIQGFLFAQPLLPEQFVEFIQQWKP